MEGRGQEGRPRPLAAHARDFLVVVRAHARKRQQESVLLVNQRDRAEKAAPTHPHLNNQNLRLRAHTLGRDRCWAEGLGRFLPHRLLFTPISTTSHLLASGGGGGALAQHPRQYNTAIMLWLKMGLDDGGRKDQGELKGHWEDLELLTRAHVGMEETRSPLTSQVKMEKGIS